MPQDQASRPTLYSLLTEKAILPLFDAAVGGRVIPFVEERMRQQWLSRGELEQIQNRRVAEMLVHCWDNVPFYRRRFEAMGANRSDLSSVGFLESVPVLSKREVMAHYKELVDRSDPRKLFWKTTGGSTGETLRLCEDRLTQSNIKAREVRFHTWLGCRQGERMGRLWGSPIDVKRSRTFNDRILRYIKNVLFLDGYNMSEASMERYAAQLLAFRPKLLVAFTSCLNVFAEFLDARGVYGIRPRAVTTTASPLYPKYRSLFEKVFGCPVYDCYGSREFGGVAHECPAHEGLHLSMEDVHVSIEADGRPVPEGEMGEMIVTGLANRAYPLVRYAIKDMGRILPRACSCGRGSVLLEVVRGRTFEILMGPKKIPVLGEYFIDLFDALPGEVLRFRIHQESPLKLRMYLVAPRELSEQSRGYVLESIAKKFGEEMRVEFVYVDGLEPLPSGKHLLTVNETLRDATGREHLPGRSRSV